MVDDQESTREDWPALRLRRGRCIEVSFNLQYMYVKYDEICKRWINGQIDR